MNKSDNAVYSMTGFSSGQLVSHGLSLDMRSVNSRFFDLTLKLPDALRHLEADFRARMAIQIKRGKCEVKLTYRPESSKEPESSVEKLSSLEALQALLRQEEYIQSVFPRASSLSVAQILSLMPSDSVSDTNIDALAQSLFHQTLNQFIVARAAEGARLSEIMLKQVRQLAELRNEVVPLISEIIESQKQKFIQRFAKALDDAGGTINSSALEERALTEATAFALRIDVTEEVDRLGSHLHEISLLLINGGEIGKRLEFLIQELQREANTLGSKSASTQTSKIAVDMKVLIEQMREQVQNLE